MKKYNFLLVCLFLVVSTLASMAQNIDLKLKNVTVEQAITALNKTGNYSVVLNPGDVDLSRIVSVDANNASIQSVMDQILVGQNLTYSVDGRMVKIIKKATAPKTNTKVNVKGSVKDAAGPLPGVAVMVKGTTNGTVTDENGEYVITVDAKDVLQFSSLGYADVEETVNNRGVINVTLVEDAQMLQDVVILGYGAATKKKDLSAAVGIVAEPEQLAKRPVTSAQAMLQGQIPGVTVESNGGSPTSTPSVIIRGQGSKNGDSVLWVVDGVPGAPINSVNDIESIVVLKDAASAAIYGAQSGAGGVILVTTKKGEKGVNISYDGIVGVRSAYRLPTPLNAQQEIDMYTTAYANAGLSLPDGWKVEKNPWVGTTRTNWIDEVFRDAVYQRHNVVINAGTDKFKNRMSFAAENNDGVLVNTYSKKMGLNYRGEYQIVKWVKLSEDFNWNQSYGKGADTNSGYTGAILSGISMPASASMTPAHYDPATDTYWYEPDFSNGYGGTTIEDENYINKYGQYASIFNDAVNPYHELHRDNYYGRTSSLFSTTGLEVGNFDKFKGFKFVSRFTFYTNNTFNKNFQYARPEIGKPSLSNGLTYSSAKGTGWKTENTITYDRTFGRHTVGVLLSTTADKWQEKGYNASASTYADESESMQYFAFSDGTATKPSDYLTGPDGNVAFIGRLAYSYDDRYFVTGSWRRDYAGRLPDDCNYGDFPAVTGAWKVSSEHWFNVNPISLLKVRASWGRVGNLGSIGYNYKSNTLSKGGWSDKSLQYGFESSYGYCGYFYYNGKALNGELTWETSEQFDLGLDINFFQDRLTASFDYYNKRTYNLIQDQSSGWPTSIGVSAMKVNLGEVMNRGVEMMIGWQDRLGDWSYFVNGNAAYNKNWVSDIGVVGGDGSKGVWTGDGSFRQVPYIYQTAEGEPLNSYYMIECEGIFQSWEDIYDHKLNGELIQPAAQPGDLKFRDANGDGKIDSNDRVYCGNSVPDWTFGLNAGFTWKDLSFSMQFYGVQGAQAANMAKFSIFNAGDNFNKDVRILDAWTETNRSSNIPRMTVSDANSNFSTPSTWYLEDASYIRCKNITISYDFTRLIRKSSFLLERGSSLMLYASGENLFTMTRYSGMDPECGGWDAMKYPVSRVMSLGVKLTF